MIYALAPPGTSSSKITKRFVFLIDSTIEWFKSNGNNVCTSITSTEISVSDNSLTASIAIRQQEP